MSNKLPKIIRNLNRGLIQELLIRLKLLWLLMKDRRVSPFLKLLPIGALAYWIIPDPIIGPIDDATVMWLGSYLFVELCPPAIVQEHMKALRNVVPGEWRDVPGSPPKKDDVIDGEFHDVVEK